LNPTDIVLNIYWRLEQTNLALKKMNWERRSDSGNEFFFLILPAVLLISGYF